MSSSLRAAGIVLVSAALAVLSGCTVGDRDSTEVRWLDYDQYVDTVQPILTRACGNPSCHGRPERPFSIYSPRLWRADPDRLFLEEPLSSEELEHNYSMSCVFATEAQAPEDALLLRKPLGSHAGSYHGGGDIFHGGSDRDYRIILRWIEGGW